MKDIFTVIVNEFDRVYTYEFKGIDIDSLTEFVVNKTFDIIEKTGCDQSDILLCIPEYLIQYLNMEHPKNHSHLSSDFSPLTNMHFCGIKVQIAFENKATIFFNSVIPDKIIKYTKDL